MVDLLRLIAILLLMSGKVVKSILLFIFISIYVNTTVQVKPTPTPTPTIIDTTSQVDSMWDNNDKDLWPDDEY